ncbi:MAG: transglutaminase domain-containing protein, partial [Chloroflexi bacterium]|nr:transglutaminase domain-containing protein [Chloroflexota bacterium]
MVILHSRLRLEEGWASFLLAMLMLLGLVWSVRAAEWVDGLGILTWISLVAMPFGLILAKARRVPSILAHLLSIGLGLAWVAILLSTTFQPPAVPAELAMSARSLSAKLEVIYQQASQWLLNPEQAEPWLSNFMFLATLAALTWLLSYASMWFVFRLHWTWGAIVPTGAAAMLNMYYGPSRLLPYFLLYCLCTLLLLVRLHVYTREKIWRRDAVNYNLDVDLTFLRDGLFVSLLALLLAWSIPTAARSPRLVDFWANFEGSGQRIQTWWTRLYSTLNYQGQSSLVNFGRTMTLGGASNLSSVPVFEVQAPEPHYWRAVAYDRYTGSGWTNTDVATRELLPGTPALNPAPYLMQSEFAHTVRMLEPGETVLFFVGQPLSSTLSARASLAYVPTPGKPATDVSMMSALKVLRSNQSYTLVSLVSKATVRQLRSAGTNYPDWIKERYLQLPASLPSRVRELAREITTDSQTPYDQAEAIQSYLRRNILYSQSISIPPAGVDVVDWLLFEKREGYCDYYATAMAVLCRAIDIPARVAQGYSAGEYVTSSRSYRVRQRDAHAWPEVYFPEYGWIEFEPTSSEPAIARPEESLLPLLPGLIVGLDTLRTVQEDKFGADEAGDAGGDIGAIQLARVKPWYTRLLHLVLVVLSVGAAASLIFLSWWHLSLRGLGPAA